MKKTLLALSIGLFISACSRDAASPPDASLQTLDDAAELAYLGSFAGDPSSRFIPNLLRLPEHLKLSAEQETQIKGLLQQFAQDTRADREALGAIQKQARDAAQAGKTRDEVRAILAQGDPIRQRLVAAEQKLRTDILALLTPEQKAWLESQQPRPCADVRLTDEQRTEISALIAAFEQANSADISAVKDAVERARAAHRDGASREEIKAILETVRPAMERLKAARAELARAIFAVLTPEQRASRCYLPHLPRG